MRRDAESILNELLVLRSQDGDAAALEQLIRRWHEPLLRHASRLTGSVNDEARDVLQNAWMAIVRNLRRLDDPAHFRAWAYRIVTNKCADRVRARQRERRLNENARRSLSRDEVNHNHASDDIGQLRSALRALPDDRRLLLSMHYLDGLSVGEIAIALSLPPGTVKSRLFHAREQLRHTLERIES